MAMAVVSLEESNRPASGLMRAIASIRKGPKGGGRSVTLEKYQKKKLKVCALVDVSEIRARSIRHLIGIEVIKVRQQRDGCQTSIVRSTEGSDLLC